MARPFPRCRPLWRTHVPGSVGWYNSILVEDLDGDSTPELYVGGSFGLWRFDPSR